MKPVPSGFPSLRLKKPMLMVVGSSNTDLVMECGELPSVGETVKGRAFRQCLGGKGANQAVAAARAGARVAFIGAFGEDEFGRDARSALDREGIDVRHFRARPGHQSGTALILVGGSGGENLIAVAPAANDVLDSADVEAAYESFPEASAILCQLEIPLRTVETAAALARLHGIPFLLNPAPALSLPDALLASVHTLIPNQGEARILTGCVDYREAARRLLDKGCRNVVITLGSEGAYGLGPEGEFHVTAPKVMPLDTVGAGDCFCGFLATGLAEGQSLPEAMKLAVRAASLSVTRPGAQDAMPFREDVVEAAAVARS